MSNVLIFTPKHQLEHENNLQEFIAFCRDLSPLNNEYTFESNYWEKVGNFTIFGANSRQRNPDELLDKSLIPFAKAYIVYGKTTKAAIDVKFKALRAINAICMKEHGQVDVTKLEISDFNGAAEIAKKKLSAEAAHQAGRGLLELLKFLIQHNMLQKITWKNPIKKPATNAVGDDADADRFKKMPDENAIMAIANIAARQTQNLNRRDIFTTSIMNLLLAAPSRGSEPFYLLADCLHKEKMAAKRALDLGLPKEDVELLLRNIFIEKLITKLALPREDIEVLLNGEISLSKALKLALPEENIDVLLSEELIEKLTTYFTLPRDNVVIGQISLRQLFELGLTQENIDTLSKDKIKCKVQPHYNWDDEIELVGIKWYSGKGLTLIHK